MRKFALLLATGVAAAALTAPALTTAAWADTAKTGSRDGRSRLFDRADANKDGKVSKAEFAAFREARFVKIDVNKDGVITREEIRVAIKARFDERRARRFGRLDGDKDGKVTEADFVARAKARFAKLDTNKDGVVSREEIREARKARGERRWKRRHARFDRARHHRRGHRFGMRRIDTDRDGKITKAEYRAAGDKLFAWLDRNKDGVIEHAELPRWGRRHR